MRQQYSYKKKFCNIQKHVYKNNNKKIFVKNEFSYKFSHVRKYGWEFSGWEFIMVGTFRVEIFRVGVYQVGVFWVGVYRVGVFQVGIFLVPEKGFKNVLIRKFI